MKKVYTLLIMMLVLMALPVYAQQAEYNTGNSWIHAATEKTVGMDFINSSTGVLMNNGTVYFQANFQNDGTVGYDNTLTVNPGLSSFCGTSAQTLSGTGSTSFYGLMFSGVSFHLQQAITVENKLDLSSGIVTAQQTTLQTVMNELHLNAGATCINTSNTSFVDGFVKKTGNTAFAFPIGNGGYYRPLSIAAPTLESDAFTARYIYADPTNGGFSRTSKVSGVGEISNKEYWVVQRSSGSSLPQVSLTWNTSTTSASVPSDLTQLQVVRWNGSQWINEGNASTTGNASAGSITANVTGYGVMSLAVKSATKQLTVKAYLQSLWNSSSQKLNKSLKSDGVFQYSTAADAVTIELHDASNYATVVYSASGLMLEPDGTIHSVGASIIDIPSSYVGSYYITIKSRNHIETTTASPVSFATESTSYDFSTSANRAYGSNQIKLKDGVYGIYAGDLNQDGAIDNLDITQMDTNVQAFATGYLSEDLNGDSYVDNLDASILNNGVSKFIYSIIP